MSTGVPPVTMPNGSRGGTTGGEPPEPGSAPPAPPTSPGSERPPLDELCPAPLPAAELTPFPPVAAGAPPSAFAPAWPLARPATDGVPSPEGPELPEQPAPNRHATAMNGISPRI